MLSLLFLFQYFSDGLYFVTNFRKSPLPENECFLCDPLLKWNAVDINWRLFRKP